MKIPMIKLKSTVGSKITNYKFKRFKSSKGKISTEDMLRNFYFPLFLE